MTAHHSEDFRAMRGRLRQKMERLEDAQTSDHEHDAVLTDDDRGRSRGRENEGIDDILKNAVLQSQSQMKRKKKGKSSNKVLEDLRKGSSLKKESDLTAEANIFHPDGEEGGQKRFISRENGFQNEGYEKDLINDEDLEPGPRRPRLKNKKRPETDAVITIEGTEGPARARLPPVKTKKKIKRPPPQEESVEELSGPGVDERQDLRGRRVSEVEEDAPLLAPPKRRLRRPTDDGSPSGGSPREREGRSPRDLPPRSPRDAPQPQRGDRPRRRRGDKTRSADEGSSPGLSQDDGQSYTESRGVSRSQRSRTPEGPDREGTDPEDSRRDSPGRTGKMKKKKTPRLEESVVNNDDDTIRPEDGAERTNTKRQRRPVPRVREPDPSAAAADTDNAPDARPDPPLLPADRILGVIVHRTDRLKQDLYVAHPVVRLQMIDAHSGQYIKKSESSRAVTSFYETKNDNVDYILPMMTQPFDFKKRKCMLPMWQEELLFNEDYNFFTQPDKEECPDVVFVFEILDFVSMNSNIVQKSTAGGWHRIAWAFLKIVGSNGTLNTERKLRLQLYYPITNYRAKPSTTEIYQWLQLPRERYPSTLYVTVKPVVIPEFVEPAMIRSMFAGQEELGTMSYAELKQAAGSAAVATGSKSKESLKQHHNLWSRLPGQICRVPNKLLLSLQTAQKGCYVIKFSHDGRSLACGCVDRDSFPILVYEIPSGMLSAEFHGHYSIIYDLCWTPDDRELVSASADATAAIWNMETMKPKADKLLPHPAFVYCAKYHPSVNSVVVTACYDSVIRIWSTHSDSVYAELLKELDGHTGLVNSLCFDGEGERLFSGDSNGLLIIWNTKLSPGQPVRSETCLKHWNVSKKIQEDELKGTAISNILLHTSGRRLMLHCKDSTIRMLDLRLYIIMQRFVGALNFREHIRSALTPCGSFVFSGSEDNSVYVWNTDSGEQVAVYTDLGLRYPVADVAYHPHDHMVAFSAYGDNQPILIYTYDTNAQSMNIGPRMTQNEGDELGLTATGTNGTLGTTGTHHRPWDRSSRSSTLDIETRQSADIANDIFASVKKQQASKMIDSLVSGTSPRSNYGNATLPGRPPTGPGPADITMDMTRGSKPRFTVRTESMRGIRVVALYDYRGQRSDELTFSAGALITILHKDTDSWWMGEFDGQQGYLPANYVAVRGDMDDGNAEELQEAGPSSKQRRNVSAVVSGEGELKFVSGPDDSSTDEHNSRQRRRRSRMSESLKP